jgi:Cupredoxin-like domain
MTNVLGRAARAGLVLSLGVLAWPVSAAENEVALIIRDHRFEPAEVRIPIQQRIKLTVHNLDSTPEEFESHALNREKVIPARSSAVIYIGPLKAGRYSFFGEFHEATAKGVLIAE